MEQGNNNRNGKTRIRKPSAKTVLMKFKRLANGKHPVGLRVLYKRFARYWVLRAGPLRIQATPKEWSVVAGRFKRNSEMNLFLAEYESRANKVLLQLDNEDFTFAKFEGKYFKDHTQRPVCGFIEEIVVRLKHEGKIKTAEVYAGTKSKIEKHKPKTEFSDINIDWLREFEKSMIASGNSVNTISIHMRTLRAVINQAIEDKIIDKSLYPFETFTIKNQETKKRALRKSDFLRIVDYPTEKGSSVWHSLNYFKFSYLCRGINFVDMAGLRWDENILPEYIQFVRKKTEGTRRLIKTTSIKIEPAIAEILAYYSSNDGYVFPIFKPVQSEASKADRVKKMLKTINKDLQSVASALKIPEAADITFYWARHTYATALKRAGVDLGTISELLGHSDLKTTQVYLDSFDREHLDKTYENLL